MFQISIFLITLAVAMATSFGAEPAPSNPTAPTIKESAPLHSRPYAVKCTATVNAWVEVDSNSLPVREYSNTETKKHVLLNLVASAASRGDAVVCNYATRSRDVTTSYSVRCLHPRKERGHRHSYLCQ
ncbi:MAG: hypothetical protein HY081_07285 [Gammaproteobacteria bacterium]|nr:hypothetical protein [Gammaproteobacteria bacterium]